jgi:hypothetical protein
MSILDLSTELLFRILDDLDHSRDVGALSACCKRLKHVYQPELFRLIGCDPNTGILSNSINWEPKASSYFDALSEMRDFDESLAKHCRTPSIHLLLRTLYGSSELAANVLELSFEGSLELPEHPKYLSSEVDAIPDLSGTDIDIIEQLNGILSNFNLGDQLRKGSLTVLILLVMLKCPNLRRLRIESAF